MEIADDAIERNAIRRTAKITNADLTKWILRRRLRVRKNW